MKKARIMFVLCIVIILSCPFSYASSLPVEGVMQSLNLQEITESEEQWKSSYTQELYALNENKNSEKTKLSKYFSNKKSTSLNAKVSVAKITLSCYGKNSKAYGSANIKLVSGKNLNGKINLYLYNKTTNGSWTQVAKKRT